MAACIGTNAEIKHIISECTKAGLEVARTPEMVKVTNLGAFVYTALRMAPNKWMVRYSEEYFPR